MSLPPCPHLPTAPAAMTANALAAHGQQRGAAFYLTALTYGQYQWQRGLPARALLCLDRAFGAELRGAEPDLQTWPLPYAALAWMLARAPHGVFVGNPRVHFQHLADRMNAPRREQRRWRAWACWALVRTLCPEYPADPRHGVREPTPELILGGLHTHGLPGEADLWQRSFRADA